MRKTGLSLLGDVPWGTHLSLFYEAREDLLAAVVPYLKTGLANNEFVLWIISKDLPLTKEDAWRALQEAVPDLDRHAAAGSIELVSHEEWFAPAGRLDIGRTVGDLNDKLLRALARGYAGMRFSGSSAWLQKEEVRDFHTFERAIDDALAQQNIVALCTFALATSGAMEILAAARKHHFAIAVRNGIWEMVEVCPLEPRTHSLTARELEVLQWAAQGKTAWEIGKILKISKRTVHEHSQTAVRKLGANNISQAVAIALRKRIIGSAPLGAASSGGLRAKRSGERC